MWIPRSWCPLSSVVWLGLNNAVCAVCDCVCCVQTRENAQPHRKESRAVRAKTIIFLTVALLLLAGCGDYWTSQGAASRTSAEARLRQAEAARQNAQAAIIDAEARGAMAESQARALTMAMQTNTDITRQAIRIADNSEYVWLFAGLAALALVLAVVAVVGMARRTGSAQAQPQPRQIATIEAIDGQVRLVQEPGESHGAFLMRIHAAALLAAEREERLLLTEARR